MKTKIFKTIMLCLLGFIVGLFISVLLNSCNPEAQECVRCKMVGGPVSGGNPNLFPNQEDYCGSSSDVKAFKDDFYQRATTWKNSWTWYGASSWSVHCDKY